MLRFLPLAFFALLALAACDSDDPTDTDPAVATVNSTVTVAYTGRLEDGTVFDQSDEATFPLNRTIPGFRNNVAGMRVGETKTFEIAPEDGYGSNPPPNSGIPPNATLIFDVELLDIE